MAHGIDLTFKVITRSKNKAAISLLESAFQSTSEVVRKLAGKILVSRRTGQGLEAIIRNFNPDDPFIVELVNSNRTKLVPGLHGAIVDKDLALARQAFRLAYTQSFYEVLPTLVAYCLGPGSQDRSGMSMNFDLLKFLNKFTAAMERNDPADHQLLYNMILPEIVRILLHKIKEYRLSRHELTLTVYLRIYPFLSEVGNGRDLHLHLQLQSSPVYASTYRRLLKESEPYLFELVIRCLERNNLPQIIPQIISERSDVPFLEALLKGIKRPLSLELRANLANLPPLPWIGQIDFFLNELDANTQCGLVLFLQNLKLKDDELQTSLLKIFELGKDEGRVAALSALATFSGAVIDRLVWDASGDTDPTVQIEALNQLTLREIPGATSRIIQFAGSPFDEVRSAIGKLLPSFRFSRFMQTFDQLDDEHRRRMFNVVKHLDKRTPIELSKMLSEGEPILKAKALLCLDYCSDVVPLVEDALCNVLLDSDVSALRCKAGTHLVVGQKETSRSALVQALHRDENADVRSAARKSLENRPVHWGHE